MTGVAGGGGGASSAASSPAPGGLSDLCVEVIRAGSDAHTHADSDILHKLQYEWTTLHTVLPMHCRPQKQWQSCIRRQYNNRTHHSHSHKQLTTPTVSNLRRLGRTARRQRRLEPRPRRLLARCAGGAERALVCLFRAAAAEPRGLHRHLEVGRSTLNTEHAT
jgi:hypothetical protein